MFGHEQKDAECYPEHQLIAFWYSNRWRTKVKDGQDVENFAHMLRGLVRGHDNTIHMLQAGSLQLRLLIASYCFSSGGCIHFKATFAVACLHRSWDIFLSRFEEGYAELHALLEAHGMFWRFKSNIYVQHGVHSEIRWSAHFWNAGECLALIFPSIQHKLCGLFGVLLWGMTILEEAVSAQE